MDEIIKKYQCKVAILLATYNGEEYLSELLESMVSQTCQDWVLYAQDDGSSDQTTNILQDYAQKYPNIVFVQDGSKHQGAKDNFFSLLNKVEAEYYFFCDQDDVWVNMKVEKSLQRMQEMEKKQRRVPIVVFSDLYVTDETLQVMDNSFMTYSGRYPQFLTHFEEFAGSNLITGCTMLINQKAKEAVVFPNKDVILMHDAWITLCVVKAKGYLSFIAEPLVFYRQHANNIIGAKSRDTFTFKYKLLHATTIFNTNYRVYKMLAALNYGSVLKYIYYKLVYKYRVQKFIKKNGAK